MVFFSDRLTAALHVARVSGVATPARVAEVVGSEDGIAELLDQATADGLFRHRPSGAMAGWSLTPEGRTAHAERLRADLQRCAFVDRLEQFDESFVEVNGPFKELCSRWQQGEDRESCISDLEPIHTRIVGMLTEVSSVDERFAGYRRRFEAAADRLHGGDHSALTKPLSGSYHDVWMELHQDLMVTLGRERTAADGN